MQYCASRFQTIRRASTCVNVGGVGIGGANPIRVQSMTTSDTQDVDATVRQSIALAEVGCEIVRITAPNVQAARCLQEIRTKLSAAGFSKIPLVADIHFLPSAAMEAVEHVEKVRVNPGNYADKKKFLTRDYSDAEYSEEIDRLYEAFSPLVKRCKELGRALRIGTNHGSLSDRIMNRYGDTPLGMVESALEFVRIAESHGFHDIILSMKASNPKVMIQAYRLLVARMDAAHRAYPLHLGVTEAGDGEDGRIKSAIGIGSLLYDGVGDTIRVSLTEDSVYEIPVAQALAKKAMALWQSSACAERPDAINPFEYTRRSVREILLSERVKIGGAHVPAVVVPAPKVSTAAELRGILAGAKLALKDTPVEGLILEVPDAAALKNANDFAAAAAEFGARFFFEISAQITSEEIAACAFPPGTVFVCGDIFGSDRFEGLQHLALTRGWILAAAAPEVFTADLLEKLRAAQTDALIFFISEENEKSTHAHGAYRRLASVLTEARCDAPIWIRNQNGAEGVFLARLLDASVQTGALLCDGLGDLVSVESEDDFHRNVRLAYNVLQGAGSRASKTEFVACPSCGRTLFDLQSTTQRIRASTGHLVGVKIAVMGCIVNGPGEMADADFGYVGGAPGKVNLYVGKTCVRYNIPENEAVERLKDLIKENGKWRDVEA